MTGLYTKVPTQKHAEGPVTGQEVIYRRPRHQYQSLTRVTGAALTIWSHDSDSTSQVSLAEPDPSALARPRSCPG